MYLKCTLADCAPPAYKNRRAATLFHSLFTYCFNGSLLFFGTGGYSTVSSDVLDKKIRFCWVSKHDGFGELARPGYDVAHKNNSRSRETEICGSENRGTQQ